jgi:hypothetical protein
MNDPDPELKRREIIIKKSFISIFRKKNRSKSSRFLIFIPQFFTKVKQ